jgi:hypothetical protein
MKSNSAKSARARNSFAKAAKAAAPLKKDASYVGELSSGYDATTPGIDRPQGEVGKAHQEAVNDGGKTDGGAHHDDKRDAVGRAATSNEQSLRQAARDLRVVAATLSRAAGRLGSYIGELSSGYDATTPGIDAPQAGKGHQEAVNEGGKTDGGAHHPDKRDTVGRAARSRGMEKLGEALLALEKEAKGGKLSDAQQSTLADTFKQLGREFDKVLDRAGALEGDYKGDAEILVSAASDDEWISVEATGHPLEDGARIHTQYEGRKVDEPSMRSEEWFKVGPGNFEDPRDAAEKATARDTADHFS